MKKTLALAAVGVSLMALSGLAAGIAPCGLVSSCTSADGGLDLPRAEFARYYREITGKDVPDGAVRFAIDPKISKTGRDAYALVSGGGRAPPPALVTITGSNHFITSCFIPETKGKSLEELEHLFESRPPRLDSHAGSGLQKKAGM